MNWKLFLTVVLLSASATFAQEEIENTESAIAEDPATASSAAPVVVSSSTSTQTTTPTPRPSTTSPSPSPSTTSTAAPVPSRQSSTSTAAPEAVTTLDSRRRTTVPTTTTPRPVPTPPKFPQNEGKWSVKGINSSCLVIHGAMQIHVKRPEPHPELVLDVPSSPDGVNVTGHCGSDEQHVTLKWYSRNETEGAVLNNTLRLKFMKDVDGQYALRSVKYVFVEHTSTTTSSGTANVTGPFFLTTLQHSFRCKSQQNLETDTSSLHILTENLQFEAFRNDDIPQGDDVFSEAEDCKADHSMSTGAILAVGVGIGLVIVACIALGTYLIKRCRRDGYQPLDHNHT